MPYLYVLPFHFCSHGVISSCFLFSVSNSTLQHMHGLHWLLSLSFYAHCTCAKINFCTCLLLRCNYGLHTSLVPQNVDEHLLCDVKYIQVLLYNSYKYSEYSCQSTQSSTPGICRQIVYRLCRQQWKLRTVKTDFDWLKQVYLIGKHNDEYKLPEVCVFFWHFLV